MTISRAQTPKNVANPSLYSKAKAKAKSNVSTFASTGGKITKTNNMGLYSRY